MTKLASIVLSGFAILITVASALADPVGFASFTQTTTALQSFVVSSTSSTVTIATTTPQGIPGGIPVSFSYTIGGTPFSMNAQNATLNLTATSSTPGMCNPAASCNTGPTFTELFTQSGYSGNFQITADTPFKGFSNLLSGTFTVGAVLTAVVGGTGATLDATNTSANLVFTSDFLTFADTTARDVTFSLSSLTNLLQDLSGTGTTNRFPTFVAAGTGAFLSAPIPEAVPEPSTFGLLASALLGLCLWQRKPRLWRR
jgi:hypothetical protein